MSEHVYVDIIHRVFYNDGFLEVGPWPDSSDCVELRTLPGKHSEEWFGKINLSMPPEAAKALGQALIACANEIITKEANDEH